MYYSSHDSKDVWSQFGVAESKYTQSRNYTDEVDDTHKNIGALKNKTENIEDRYYGEDTSTYNTDKKYFGPTVNATENAKKNESNSILLSLGLLLAIILLPP